MGRRKNMNRSTAETEQYDLYTEFLSDPANTNHKALSKNSIHSYAGSVAADGKLTAAAREAGCLPEGVESLLTMTDPGQIQAVRDWWEWEGQDGLAGRTSHMNHWLRFRGADPLSPQPPAAPDLPLQKPPHGVRLRFLLRAFFSEARSLETSDTLKLLCSLTGCQYSLESLREHTSAFRQLRWDLLHVMENAPRETAARLARQYGRNLKGSCRNIVTQVLRQHGEQLLTDLSQRRVAYEGSLLPPLEAMRHACLSGASPDCAGAFLKLIQAVLEDCDPARLAGDPALSPSDTLKYACRQAWKPGTRENIGWPDICEIALISRELDLRSAGMTADQRLAQKERETGLVYREQGGELLLEDYTARLSTGERVHVCPADDGDQSGRALEMRTVK